MAKMTMVQALNLALQQELRNYPEVAILRLGEARMQPVVRENEGGEHIIVPRLMMPIVLCIDHRVLDGADAIRFLKVIINSLEDPDQLLMNMV